MSLKEQIDADIKKAMIEKNKDDLRALRAIKSMILLAQTEKGAEVKSVPTEGPVKSDETVQEKPFEEDKPKVASEKNEPKPVVQKEDETKKPAITPNPAALGDEKFETQYQKLSGATITGQKIDLSQFEKPKKS